MLNNSNNDQQITATNASMLDTDFAVLAGDVFSAFETAYLVVARESSTVVWTSPGAEILLPALISTASASLSITYPALERLVKDAFSNSSVTANSPVSLVIDGKSYQCQSAPIREDHIGLMINADTDTFAQFSKYMADREQLFTTSRTITVSEMATSLAHEINQPVGSIANILKGLKARLKRDKTIPDEYVTALDRALEQTSFAARIVSRIRDFTSSRQPKRVDCNVQKLLEDSIQLLDWVLMNANVRVELAPVENTIWVNADATMLQQVFTNLIRNAVDSMQDSSRAVNELKIHAFLQRDEVHIEISDNGHGLSDTAKDNIFIPFVTQKTQGMGVGLNICRSFVELHQGKLWLMPNDNGGCTASVLLPAAEQRVETS